MKYRVGDRLRQVYPDTGNIIPRMPIKVITKKLKHHPVKGYFRLENEDTVHFVGTPLYPETYSKEKLSRHYVKLSDLGNILYEPPETSEETS